MSLDLDHRQRALLQEMGVHVWWPQAAPEVEPEPAVALAPQVQAPPVPPAQPMAAPQVAPSAIEALARSAVSVSGRAPGPQASPLAPLAGEVAAMDWARLSQTVTDCQACKLCVGRRAPVFPQAFAPAPADWLVVSDPPDEAEERAGMPFVEHSGQLLDNMLRAVGVRRQDAQGLATGAGVAYLTHVAKCRPASPRSPVATDLAACEAYLQREIALVQPKVILVMGRFAIQTVLREHLAAQGNLPLGKLRGHVYRYQGISVVVSYHPVSLLRTPSDKARAWADLCLAQEAAGSAP